MQGHGDRTLDLYTTLLVPVPTIRVEQCCVLTPNMHRPDEDATRQACILQLAMERSALPGFNIVAMVLSANNKHSLFSAHPSAIITTHLTQAHRMSISTNQHNNVSTALLTPSIAEHGSLKVHHGLCTSHWHHIVGTFQTTATFGHDKRLIFHYNELITDSHVLQPYMRALCLEHLPGKAVWGVEELPETRGNATAGCVVRM